MNSQSFKRFQLIKGIKRGRHLKFHQLAEIINFVIINSKT